jgi:hypothetical protein
VLLKPMPKRNHARSPLVYIVHTSFVSVDYLRDQFKTQCPEAEVRHIVDDSLLAEVLANGKVTPGVRRRMLAYYQAAESAGATLIFNQCSSVGEVADYAAKRVRTPVVKVDTAMAEAACRIGGKIGVVATLPTTLGPTCRLVERCARRLRRAVEVVPCLVEGAFAELIAGNRDKHNRMVLKAIRRLTREVDVVVCAQGSMVAILSELGRTRVPVLTSPALGVQQARARLSELSAAAAR